MSKALRYLIMLTLALNVAFNAAVGNNQQKMSREKFAEIQAMQYARELSLNDEQTTQFVKTYCECQKELWSYGPQKNEADKRNSDKRELTEDEARRELTNRFTHWRKFNDVQEKYYKKYSKFMSQVEIFRFYELERKHMDKMRRNGKNRPQRSRKAQSPR